jgi:predicted RNA-binding protein YlqC (UPF0109 family)
LSKYAPRIITLQVKPDRIGDIIGPKGKTIRSIQDQPAVVHVDLRPGLILDAPNRLSFGPDDLSDPIRLDLERDDAGRILGQGAAGLGQGLRHHIQNVQPRLPRLVQRLPQDVEAQALDLDVHLDRGHPVARAGDLEIHVP